MIIAIGKCAETKFWIDLASDEGFVKTSEAETIGSEYEKLGFMLHNLWKEWRQF
jgi:four helix bundle protein